MSLSLLNAMFSGNFFNTDSQYVNHKLVNIISIDDEQKVAHVVLQRYLIGGGATVSTNGKQIFNVEIPYAEFGKVIR